MPEIKRCSDLEEIRWGGKPQCPYCGSTNSTPIKKELRYHCNSCFTSYSVTVGTLFHKTHVDLQKWYQAIQLVLTTGNISVRKLAQEIEVNKNTASYMLVRIRKAMIEEQDLLYSLVGINKS
ncbi:IS1595 family transposase [Kamptonema animale CS-326]|jgi:transposase-like protein|uniref:IS1595 family transposase n=1 Tax=Kamptonema animale TaxID=92934 RepID=UPI00232E9D4D|nr:IS1595 family transposase [Kamptonema animale]MDB9511053.1 IS1595 family transposase [Kamptonema animale CS-326]